MAGKRQDEYGGRQSERREHQENLAVRQSKQSTPGGGQSVNQVDDSIRTDSLEETIEEMDENLQAGGSRGPSNENKSSTSR